MTERGLQFDPDIAIFVMSIGDFLSTALGDDSKNPGYVLDESGKLTIGYGFRQRRSQRLRDEPIGRLFFWLMDHSRVALAIYAKQRKEIGGDVFRPGRVTTVSPRPSPCELVEAKLADNLDLWRDGRPELQARRLERYLEDVGALAAENRLPTVFIFRRLGYPSGQCPEIHARRQALVEQIKERLGRHEIFMADADALIYGRVGSLAETRKLRGFGANLGSGHLNEFGHAVYAELLARIIEETAAP